MVHGLWGKKVGMTQLFVNDKVVPVTVIDTGRWFVTAIKTVEKDGYNAVQIGCVRDRYTETPFDPHWLQSLSTYFAHVREVKLGAASDDLTVGQAANFIASLSQGQLVDVFGLTKGRGFAGVVKRHNFAGGRSSHGSTFHRRPGGISHMRSRGRVIKGKRMPGHMGVERVAMQNLQVVQINPESQYVAIKGSVPGHVGSLVYIQKRG